MIFVPNFSKRRDCVSMGTFVLAWMKVKLLMDLKRSGTSELLWKYGKAYRYGSVRSMADDISSLFSCRDVSIERTMLIVVWMKIGIGTGIGSNDCYVGVLVSGVLVFWFLMF